MLAIRLLQLRGETLPVVGHATFHVETHARSVVCYLLNGFLCAVRFRIWLVVAQRHWFDDLCHLLKQGNRFRGLRQDFGQGD